MGHPACRWLPLLWLCATASLAAAADLHVSPAGNDATGDGSQARPYREIRRAIEKARPGDTVLVADGRYRGFNVFGVGATADRPLTIRAQGLKAEVLPTEDRRDNRDTIYIDGSSWVTIEGLRAFNGKRAGVRIEGGGHVTIRNCVFGDNETWGIFTGHSDDLLIEGNQCYGSRKEHGIYVGNSGDRPVVRYNRVYGNAGCGIHMNADLSCGGDGIISGATIEGNIIYGNGRRGGSAINMDGVQDSLVRGNLLYDNHASGIACFRMNGAAGPSGMRIVHNTVVMAADARYALQIGQTAGSIVVRNNIFYSLSPRRGGIAYHDATADPPRVDSDYNVFSTEAPFVAVDDWRTRYDLPRWQAMGREGHSLAASMKDLFADPAANDFRLAPGSPARRKGQVLPGGTGDETPPDIGCAFPLKAPQPVAP